MAPTIPIDETAVFRFLSFERIAFAHDFSATDYAHETENEGYDIYGETPEKGGILEVGYVETNPVYITFPGFQVECPEDGIFIIPPNVPFKVRTKNPGHHRHVSAEFLITTEPGSENDQDPRNYKLPVVLLPSEENREILSIIRRIADTKSASLSMNYFEECELFMRLMRRLMDRANAVAGLSGISPGNKFLCKRVKTYISLHLQEHIAIGDIASAIGVSKNYLTTVFTKTEGMPLTKYINNLRLSHLTDLVRKYGYSLAKAGEQVGFHDTNYLSRVFRQYTGMSFTEFKSTVRPGD